MPLKKTEAIVLKSQRQGETSKFLTLYTKAFGKLKVIAKGARAVRSKFGGNLEPINHIAIVFYEKESREIQILSQAEILESFNQLKADVEKTAVALAVCELINRLEVDSEPNARLFHLHLETLKTMNKIEHPMNAMRAFQLKLFEVMGFKPNLAICLNCQQSKSEAVVFDLSHGGFVCESCNQGRKVGMVLSKEAMQVLNWFQENPMTQVNGISSSSITQQQIDDFINAYFRCHVEGFYELNAFKFLNKIKLN